MARHCSISASLPGSSSLDCYTTSPSFPRKNHKPMRVVCRPLSKPESSLFHICDLKFQNLPFLEYAPLGKIRQAELGPDAVSKDRLQMIGIHRHFRPMQFGELDRE
ncbi:MAG: hypothetical protein RL768_1504 [Nitrospirota bacterium]